MRSAYDRLVVLVSVLAFRSARCLDLDISNSTSVRNAAATIAFGLQTYYVNNASNTPPEQVGVLPGPYYWWESGAMWGSLVDYWAYTGDASYVDNTINAFVAQSGPNRDLMNPPFFFSTGNDDQAFWALSLMSAVETGFPSPRADLPQYLPVVQAAFDTQAARWDTAGCNGGLRWQIFPDHAGYNYMNTISNGAFFQLAARLARYTGNSTYLEWAERSWDWCSRIGLISPSCEVFDGTDSSIGCIDVNHLRWTYNQGVFLYGAASLYNYTNASSIWRNRVDCLLQGSAPFFSPYENASNIMSEAACENMQTCNVDQQSFKAYFSRWLAKASIIAPFTRSAISTLLTDSAIAAARSCSGGTNGVTCGTKWYTEGWDGTAGAGQQMSALEVIQALLVAGVAPPRTGPDVVIEPEPSQTSQAALPSRTTGAIEGFRPDPPTDPSQGNNQGSNQSSATLVQASISIVMTIVFVDLVVSSLAL